MKARRLTRVTSARTGAVLALAVLSLSAGSQAEAPGDSAQPSVTLPTPLARVLTDYETAWRNKDAAALADLFAEEGFVLSSATPPVRGRDEIRKHYTGRGGPLALRALAFATEGPVGYIIGAYARKEDEADVGKFTLTLRQAPSGRWLIVSDMDNGNAPAGPASTSADEDQLKALHAKVIRAHRESNVELLLEDEAADYVVANRGVVTRPTLDERRRRLGPYLQGTAFHEYRDLVDPVVSVSTDGTLGWVVVQIQAGGLQTGADGQKEPLEFGSAWIELYAKRKGRWLRVGNVSNFRESR